MRVEPIRLPTPVHGSIILFCFPSPPPTLGLRTGSRGGSRIGGRVAVDVLGEALGKGRRDFLLEGLEGAVRGFRVGQVAFAAGAGYAADDMLVSLAQHDEICAPADIAKLRVRHLHAPEARLTPDQQVQFADTR